MSEEDEDEPKARFWMADLVHHGDEDGWRPDFPEGAGFLLLADGRSVRWGIYRCHLARRFAESHRIQPLAASLCVLLEAGYRYPPAIALAREDISRKFRTAVPSREEFQAAYATALRKRLSEQADAPYILAESTRFELGYLAEREWYWVLRVRSGERTSVLWVSDDFFIYQNPVEDFALSPAQVRRLSGSGDL